LATGTSTSQLPRGNFEAHGSTCILMTAINLSSAVHERAYRPWKGGLALVSTSRATVVPHFEFNDGSQHAGYFAPLQIRGTN
jgi:hypothetical protein